MVGDFHTKPLQGSQFCELRRWILNISPDETEANDVQECVGPQDHMDQSGGVKWPPASASEIAKQEDWTHLLLKETE